MVGQRFFEKVLSGWVLYWETEPYELYSSENDKEIKLYADFIEEFKIELLVPNMPVKSKHLKLI